MKLKNFIWYTGLWLYPVTTWLCYFVCLELDKYFVIPGLVRLLIAYALPLLPPIIVTITNRERQQRDQTDFSFAATYGLGDKDEKQSKAYHDAVYPEGWNQWHCGWYAWFWKIGSAPGLAVFHAASGSNRTKRY